MKEGYVHSEKFVLQTLKVSFLPGGKSHHYFDENVPVMEQLEDDGTGDYQFRHGLLYWSLQQGIRVDPDEHRHQSLKQMAAKLARRNRLDEQAYKSYREWVFRELGQLEITLEEMTPSKEVRDKDAYLKSEN